MVGKNIKAYYQISEGGKDFLCTKAVEEITAGRSHNVFNVKFLYVQKGQKVKTKQCILKTGQYPLHIKNS